MAERHVRVRGPKGVENGTVEDRRVVLDGADIAGAADRDRRAMAVDTTGAATVAAMVRSEVAPVRSYGVPSAQRAASAPIALPPYRIGTAASRRS